jgi:hypothetical protein
MIKRSADNPRLKCPPDRDPALSRAQGLFPGSVHQRGLRQSHEADSYPVTRNR